MSFQHSLERRRSAAFVPDIARSHQNPAPALGWIAFLTFVLPRAQRAATSADSLPDRLRQDVGLPPLAEHRSHWDFR